MSNLTVSYTISRTAPLGGGVALQLENPGSYRVVKAGPGSVTWIREVAKSPFAHGATQIGATKDETVAPLTVRVYGTSAADLEAKTAAMLAAFDQFDFVITATIDGVQHSWACNNADYAPGDNGEWDPYHLRALQQVYTFRIPRSPVPILGSM